MQATQKIKIISAGAGSGKTYRLTSELVKMLQQGIRPSAIIATTFTQKAAAELQERVRVRLLENGLNQQADDINNALIGTVHSLGVRLLRRFAYEAGVSPQVDIVAEEDQQALFNQSLANVLTEDRVTQMEHLCERLGLNKKGYYDWRREVKNLSDLARANDFDEAALLKSRELSFSSFQEFLPTGTLPAYEDFHTALAKRLAETIARMEAGDDATKKSHAALDNLRQISRELKLKGELPWHYWVKLTKLDVGVKSKDAVTSLMDFCQTHEQHPAFHEDIRSFIYAVFDIAIAALQEFDLYKKRRGLIDYTDMEALVYRLLDQETVKEVLAQELDLLLVDEFQDTNPLQLAIFLKLSRFAKYAIWVGDPKQSIYGFRGAEPRLMQAIIDHMGGIQPEDIQEFSWRSRRDIVFATNAIFTKAFHELPVEQVALQPKRASETEPDQAGEALVHWHFQPDEEGRHPGQPWMENCIADQTRHWLDSGQVWVQPKGSATWRKAIPGDVAILCRSNKDCQLVAESLHRAGLRASVARAGLLNTAEAKLVLACLKYILNYYDSLSIAEILLLAENRDIEAIIEDRLQFLENSSQALHRIRWAETVPIIITLDQLREQVVELSATEMLNLLLETLDLRRTIASWGNLEQRLDNVEAIRRLGQQYEDACNRLHSAATLGGLLLWFNELENAQRDFQGAGESDQSVKVLTYHKSKGLEWPIVICHNLTERLRAEVWGLDLIPEKETVDLDNVLSDRWLRYWVNPYADQYQNTPLAERMEGSEAQLQKTRQALKEEARLLYVGITRARDYLVLPTSPRPTSWLNRVFHEGKEEFPTLDPHSNESPWHWQGHFLNIQTNILLFPRVFTYAEMKPGQQLFLAPRAGRQFHRPFKIDLNRNDHGVLGYAQVASRFNYASPLPYSAEGPQAYREAKCVKAFLHADRLDYSSEERLAIADQLSVNFNLAGSIDRMHLVTLGEQWRQWLERQHGINAEWRKYPLKYFHGQQLFETIVDLVLDTPNGLVLIQNSSFHGDPKSCERKALDLGHWLGLSKLGMEKALEREVSHTYVHFVLLGRIVEVISTIEPPAIANAQLQLF